MKSVIIKTTLLALALMLAGGGCGASTPITSAVTDGTTIASAAASTTKPLPDPALSTPRTLTPELDTFFDYEWKGDEGPFWENPAGKHYGDEGFFWEGDSVWDVFHHSGFEQNWRASTMLDGQKKYAAGNLGDNDRSNAWVEGANGDAPGETSVGVGEFASVILSARLVNDMTPTEKKFGYTDVWIVNGYAKNEQTWNENSRVKRLLMLADGEPFAVLELKDVIQPQHFAFRETPLAPSRPEQRYFAYPSGWDEDESGRMVTYWNIEFTFIIQEVYPRTKYEDTCLTGITFGITADIH